MDNRRHLGGLNLKAKALKVGRRVKFDVIKCQSSIPQTKLYKWSKFEGLSFTCIHNNTCNPEFGIEWKNPAYRGGPNKSVLFHSIENHIPYH